jgi:hypothetical protein
LKSFLTKLKRFAIFSERLYHQKKARHQNNAGSCQLSIWSQIELEVCEYVFLEALSATEKTEDIPPTTYLDIRHSTRPHRPDMTSKKLRRTGYPGLHSSRIFARGIENGRVTLYFLMETRIYHRKYFKILTS